MSIAIQTAPANRAKRAVQPGTTRWFAHHEARLIWRDFTSMMTGGRPARTAAMIVIVGLFIVGLHFLAAHLLGPVIANGIGADRATLLMISGVLILFFSLMFSQAIESVTRAYYARSDLDLILTSPAPSHRLFQVRTSVLTAQTISLSLLIATPVLNVLVVMDGARWLAGYPVLLALGAMATALAVTATLVLFKWVGPQRTRLVAQIVAAVVGAGFVIALQAVGIMLGQGFSKLSLFRSEALLSIAPELGSWAWLPATAMMGNGASLAMVMVLSALVLLAVIHVSSHRFAEDVLAAAGLREKEQQDAVFLGFRKDLGVAAHLRRKEWKLLARDPWLVSQTLQQILYLIPPALLLWMNYGEGDGLYYVIVPVVVMAVGQLSGGLAWISISGEDAHELIVTAPISPRAVLWAKVQAVLAVIGVVLLPFIVVLAVAMPRAAVFLALGGALSAGGAVMLQLWFRAQANRSLFRRRQVSSKVATICEALVSILFAAAAGLAILHVVFGVIPFLLALVVLGFARFLRPR